ncbi:MAG: response regulator [Desulfobacula sp.]|nr:response regulator [Desulfobacula sp.]
MDDEISIVNMVQKMFERLGYKVETATTPQDALERFALNPDHFDLVITDMTMPQMTGVNLSEKLKFSDFVDSMISETRPITNRIFSGYQKYTLQDLVGKLF